jgi:hypothetical protein
MKHVVWALLLWALPAAAAAEPCCGPITADGLRLAAVLDKSGVETLWLAGWHVDWRSGEKDRAEPGGPEAKTHCSAFAAAIAARLGVYLLRPPEHPQNLLANAQMGWLRRESTGYGWQKVTDAASAQAMANRGMLVVELWENPNPHRPGHIAIIRPSAKTKPDLDDIGPQETQAGATNALSTTTAAGFRHHKGAWEPGGGTLQFYAHPIDWTKLP